MRASAVVADPCCPPFMLPPFAFVLGQTHGSAPTVAVGRLSAWWWRSLYWMERPRRPAAGRRFCRLRPFRAAGCRLSCREKPHNAPRYVAFRGRGKPAAGGGLGRGARRRGAKKSGSSRKPFVWYIKVYPVPEGGKLSLTAGGVSAANVTCGKSKLLQPSPKGANGVLGYAVAGSYGYAVCPYTPITV